MGQSALSGNINAVGLLELLRIPMTTKRTGTLIVVCADPDADDVEARFEYADGSLVAGSLGPLTGEDALRRMLTWKDGEFEFIPDTVLAAPLDERLHSIVLTELKSWYAARSASRNPSSGSRPSSSVRQIAARSSPQPPAVAPPHPALRAPPLAPPVAALSPAPAPSVPPSSTLGAGSLDARGNLRDATGQLNARDGAVVFAALQLAAVIGKDMGVGAPKGVEIRGKGERWLAAAVRGDSAKVVACVPDADPSEELERC
jgi:hypothetical protein